MISSRHSQRGITLIEMLVSIAIMASIMTGIVALTNQQSEDTRASVTALHLKTVGDAANAYIKDNYAAVTSVATNTTPALITVDMLVTAGYLNSGFSLKNARQQNTCVLVLAPSANKLIGMVVTEGGDTLDDLTLGQVAATVGASGGGIYSTATTTFKGAMGGWSMPFGAFSNANDQNKRCDGTSGAVQLAVGHPVMALWFNDGTAVSATLYRDAVPGNPSLNTMNTPILMGAGTVQVTDQSSPASVCSVLGAIGRDIEGNVVTCVDPDGPGPQTTLRWVKAGGRYWGDPGTVTSNTPSQSDLDAALGVCSNFFPPKGRTHMVFGPSGQPRAYVCDGTDWQPVAVDLDGKIDVPKSMRLSTADASPTEGGDCSAYGVGSMARDTSGNFFICK